MKIKTCALCYKDFTTLFRVQIVQGKAWIFVCEPCLMQAKTQPNYRYGGTWKASRH